jgi:predicted MarR family transcription regulator
MSILWTICRHLGWQSYECTKTAADLCELTRTDRAQMARALDLLEQVGAIQRVKRGRVKIITVTPEGAFRGNVNAHGQTVERYKLDVIDGGKADPAFD